ncbi:unnamed protein product [Didymodactylos carnosus]|uniref:Uncharacterized protein n=1 Tax=Didymodactylos carnosus TaxID=1234261 RepID=A0A8S2D841_9BILA|nr:unnamed protein product [Didymodactylos carnosus]CAF3683319.1 unnamed protein product [Didymodactylos carnosus]
MNEIERAAERGLAVERERGRTAERGVEPLVVARARAAARRRREARFELPVRETAIRLELGRDTVLDELESEKNKALELNNLSLYVQNHFTNRNDHSTLANQYESESDPDNAQYGDNKSESDCGSENETQLNEVLRT